MLDSGRRRRMMETLCRAFVTSLLTDARGVRASCVVDGIARDLGHRLTSCGMMDNKHRAKG